MRKLLPLVGCAFLLLVGAGQASASSGGFSNAFATPDWKYARFAVSGSATPCQSGYCSYAPVVTAVPALPGYQSCREVALDSDPNTQMAWSGATMTANGSFSAETPKASILNGVYGQRLCLALLGTREVKDVLCETQSKTWEEFWGEPGWPCPPIKVLFEEVLSSALLTVEPPPPAQPSSPPAPPKAPTVKKPKKCPKGKRAVKRNGKRVCVKKQRRGGTKR